MSVYQRKREADRYFTVTEIPEKHRRLSDPWKWKICIYENGELQRDAVHVRDVDMEIECLDLESRGYRRKS